MSEALTKRGFTVSIAHDAEAAVMVARRSAPAYAVVDLVMRGRSGLELVAELNSWGTEIRIVVLTGYASIATAVESIKLGAVHYLTKPTDAEEIVAAFGRDRATSEPRFQCNPCPYSGYNGSICRKCCTIVAATSPRRLAALACIGGHCSAS